MQITIHEDVNKIKKIYISNWLILNKVVIRFIYKTIKQNLDSEFITKRQLYKLLRFVKKNIKQYKGLELIEVETKNNEYIKIII